MKGIITGMNRKVYDQKIDRHAHEINRPLVLIVTAVDAEKDAILQGLGDQENIDVLAGGVGPIVSAVRTSHALFKKRYELVINMGIGGGFQDRAEIGSIVVGTEMIAADFGIETPDGFYLAEVFELGLSRITSDARLRKRLINAFRLAGLKFSPGPILTVSTVTGTESTAIEMKKREPKATAEAMEGFGVAVAAQIIGIPVIEIRTISNMVGIRDKKRWRINEALESLTQASRIMKEVFR